MSSAETPRRGAGGRPPAAQRAEVDGRLLDAATRLFLTLGYEATSCDQVALDARAGKASIYARYANKTALMTAVIDYNLKRLFDAGAAGLDAAQPLRERILDAARAVLDNALRPDAVALLRLIVAETPRLQGSVADSPAIVQSIGARQLAMAIGARPLPAGRQEAAATAAAALIDMVLMPALLRALLGEDPVQLQETALERLAPAVDVLLAGGELAGWE
jgi:AcrR family transcriptional regulator